MIVVTGGAGFIGSCLLWKLNNEGITDILVVDTPKDGHKRGNLEGKKYRDCIDKKEFISRVRNDGLPDGIDAIFHLGACSSTLVLDMDYLMENNVRYTRDLAEYAVRRGIRFIYASSGATYGDGSRGFKDDDATTLSLKPLNPYGRSKHMVDVWAIEKGLTSTVVGLKYFNVFGPNEYHKEEMRSVIAKSFDAVLRDRTMTLFRSHKPDCEDGEQRRDFIYVKDAVEVTYFFMQHRQVAGIFNVGTGNARTWNDLARSLCIALDMEPSITYRDMPTELRGRYQYFTEADISRLRRAGYGREFWKLEDAVKEYVTFLKNGTHL